MTKVLLLDIETAPNVAYVWRFFKENVGGDQVIKNSEIISFACKWLDEDYIYYSDVQRKSEKEVLKHLNRFLDEADVVITHYGNVFDIPRIKARSMANDIAPPSPYKLIDTCLTAKREFSFESNSLDYVSKALGCKTKGEHKKYPGFKLWKGIMEKDPEAWKEMEVYNKRDVEILEQVYLKMRPWIRNHPNLTVHHENEDIHCPKCGSDKQERRGFYHSNVGKYQRYRCHDCGGWHRSRFTEYPKDKRKALTVNAR